jgi:WSC domain
MDTCYAAGYSYAGVEYSAECYCGNAVVNGGTLEDASGCDMTCQANNLLYCGGPNRLNLYKYNGVVPPPTTPPPPPPGGGGGGVGPVTTGLPTPWYYSACYVDLQYGRILGYEVTPSASNSVATCIAACQAQGFTLAGTEYADECYCGNALQSGATQATADTDCDM